MSRNHVKQHGRVDDGAQTESRAWLVKEVLAPWLKQLGAVETVLKLENMSFEKGKWIKQMDEVYATVLPELRSILPAAQAADYGSCLQLILLDLSVEAEGLKLSAVLLKRCGCTCLELSLVESGMNVKEAREIAQLIRLEKSWPEKP